MSGATEEEVAKPQVSILAWELIRIPRIILLLLHLQTDDEVKDALFLPLQFLFRLCSAWN